MTLYELSRTLPNGIHDADLYGFSVSLLDGTAALDVSLLINDVDEETRYRDAKILLSGVIAFVVEGPAVYSDFISGAYFKKTITEPVREALGLDGFVTTVDKYPGLSTFTESVQKLFYSLYVLEPWNSNIHIAAESADIVWGAEVPMT